MENLYLLPFIKRRPDQKAKQHHRSQSARLCQLGEENWVKLLSMPEFAYKNAKNINISYTTFELNYRFYPRASYKKDVNCPFKF